MAKKKPAPAGFTKSRTPFRSCTRPIWGSLGGRLRLLPPWVPTKSSNRLKDTTNMYNCYTKRRICLFLYTGMVVRMGSAVLVWLAAAGAGAANAQNTIELRGRQPDHPMMRGGKPLVVDGQTVRIAGSEFIFRISPTGPDSLLRNANDGRIFPAAGECTPDGRGGWQCAFVDTAGNPLHYALLADSSDRTAWRCIGRTTEPEFLCRHPGLED